MAEDLIFEPWLFSSALQYLSYKESTSISLPKTVRILKVSLGRTAKAIVSDELHCTGATIIYSPLLLSQLKDNSQHDSLLPLFPVTGSLVQLVSAHWKPHFDNGVAYINLVITDFHTVKGENLVTDNNLIIDLNKCEPIPKLLQGRLEEEWEEEAPNGRWLLNAETIQTTQNVQTDQVLFSGDALIPDFEQHILGKIPFWELSHSGNDGGIDYFLTLKPAYWPVDYKSW